jgi:hypothetical protein
MSSDVSNGRHDSSATARNGARNQALIRELNEQVCAFPASETDPSMLVICECTKVGCSVAVTVTRSAYDTVRQSPTRFIVRPGHTVPDVERVVTETDGYTVIEKLGEGAEIATRLYLRRQP